MKGIFYSLIFFILLASANETNCFAQEIIKLYEGTAPGSENWNYHEQVAYDENGEVQSYTDVVDPAILVYLPSKEKATGTAVIVCPGGGLRQLSVGNGFMDIANWLNGNGIAAIFLKYRLVSDKIPGDFEEAPMDPNQMLRLEVHEFGKLEHANAIPTSSEKVRMVLDLAGTDLRQAFKLVRQHAADWNLDPYRIGCMGFSAGGGVIFNAITDTSSPETLPDFIASVYGPSLNDLQVPEPAPPLFIAVESGHTNVAAGCLALFNEWQAAGGSAEIHIYGQGNGPFSFTGNPLPSDSWKDSFLAWLKAEGF